VTPFLPTIRYCRGVEGSHARLLLMRKDNQQPSEDSASRSCGCSPETTRHENPVRFRRSRKIPSPSLPRKEGLPDSEEPSRERPSVTRQSPETNQAPEDLALHIRRMNRQFRMRDPRLIAFPKECSCSTRASPCAVQLSHPSHPKTAWGVYLCERFSLEPRKILLFSRSHPLLTLARWQ
jgi:hypothetical protein